MQNLGYSKTIVIGYIDKLPKISVTGSGKTVANFTLITSQTWKDQATGERREVKEFHKVACFGVPADIVRDKVKCGMMIMAEGQMKTRSWDQNGTKKTITELNATNVQIIDWGNHVPFQTNNNPQYVDKTESVEDFFEDMPF